ncbi:TIGR03943 family protein [Lacrimispora amygdalina]|uniref:TIGR03943 family protein n=1 Tax=Lacrimispora amygdalina TaxID=253257 RepID=A0A3E2N7P6_9FIRM|nr:TIGR03943 family protein [Clostridium indicum]RFZ76982.1 TIGR03943 family protein [Clostridium indicum]
MKKTVKVLNSQVLIEIVCQISFGGMIAYLAASGDYLRYVTPRMRPYLYFTACIMGLWALAGTGRLFRPRYKIRMNHCFLLIIPVLIMLLPHTPIDISSYNTIGESSLQISQAERKEPEHTPDQAEETAGRQQETVPLEKTSAKEENENAMPGLNKAEKKIMVSDDLFGMWYSELYMHMEQYEGYTISITGYVLKDPKVYGENEFAVARLAMTCCVADLAPAGLLCNYREVPDLKEDSWITVEGTLTLNYEDYDGHKYANPIIMVTKITPAEKVEGYVYPY